MRGARFSTNFGFRSYSWSLNNSSVGGGEIECHHGFQIWRGIDLGNQKHRLFGGKSELLDRLLIPPGMSATDTNGKALRLLNKVNHPAEGIYWQPREATSVDERLEGLRMILPGLQPLHVFNWNGVPTERRPPCRGL
jgi:hypothetical protein